MHNCHCEEHVTRKNEQSAIRCQQAKVAHRPSPRGEEKNKFGYKVAIPGARKAKKGLRRFKRQKEVLLAYKTNASRIAPAPAKNGRDAEWLRLPVAIGWII